MNKSALKRFATSARIELLERVELQARKYGLTEEIIEKNEVVHSDDYFINGKPLEQNVKTQRNKLISRIKELGFTRVMEEVAYTWFNRFTALRFMEVNDYLPTKVRVLSSRHEDSNEPEMIKEAMSLDLDIDKEKIYEFRMNNQSEALFKYLIIQHCNDLNRYMPFMFEKIDDYTEILFPDGLLATDSFIREMTNTEVIPEENWGKVEIIGWLYQYYISDENERVIQAKKRYKAEEIPFATQLFTPEWIVRYMVQNALGRYWIESHPEHRDLIENWEFYLENPNPEEDFEEKIAPYINKDLKVEGIKCFDPAMGSGHILVYMFDVLHEIYSKAGYMEREIPRLIIENNLYGLDIDDRAYQLACFSVVIKALEHNPRFLRSIDRHGLTMNLASIQETNMLTDEEVAFLAGESSGDNFDKMVVFLNQFEHAKAIGSLIKIENHDAEFLDKRLQAIKSQSDDLFTLDMKDRTLTLLEDLIKQATIMNQQYDVFITNPPYARRSYMTAEITKYVDKHYPDVKSDLFSVFIQYSFDVTKQNGQMGFMSPYLWMFISSYEKLRNNIINNRNISSLIQLEYSGFDGATVPICTFTLRNYETKTPGEYIKLSDFSGAENQPIKTLEAVQNPTVSYRYSFHQQEFRKIPTSPITFYVSEKLRDAFRDGECVGNILEAKQGLITGDVARFTKKWHEVSVTNIGFSKKCREDARLSRKMWFPYNNGGGYRKWYGNNEDIVNWENDGHEIINFVDNNGKQRSRPQNLEYYFKPGSTWTAISSSNFSLRSFPEGFIFSNAGMGVFGETTELVMITSLLNSKITKLLLSAMNEGLNFNQGDIARIPYIETDLEKKNIISNIYYECVSLSKNDWDSFEISWDFKKHPLMHNPSLRIKEAFQDWERFAESQFVQLQKNEEGLNKILIDIYGLQGELNSTVEESDVTIRKAELERDIKSFISYAIGCAFGRYSLDEEGLIYAGGEFDPSRYESFPADEDNIIPILPGAYFEDDMVSRFVEFVRVTFGEESLEENLEFVADAIKRRKNETAREALRRYFMNDFYKGHVRTYKKRPIYWLFTSGKEKAFNCLIYMHRYDKTTLSRIRTDYLHETQIRYDVERQDLVNIIEGDYTTREINAAKRELTSIDKKIAELKAYDEVLHHMADMQIEIDLDDGVDVNYGKFEGLVAKR